MADVNFFILSKSTSNGIFSTYRGAGGTTVFGNLLRKLYRQTADSAAETEIEELVETSDGISKEDQKAVKAKYRAATLKLTPIMTDPDFEKDLKRFARISQFEYIEPTVHDSRFGPVRKQISKQRRVYYFKKQNIVTASIRKFLAKFVAGSDIAEGKVHGYLRNGEYDNVPIHPEVYCLAKYPHDSVVIPENIRLNAVAEVPMIGELVNLAATRRELFA